MTLSDTQGNVCQEIHLDSKHPDVLSEAQELLIHGPHIPKETLKLRIASPEVPKW